MRCISFQRIIHREVKKSTNKPKMIKTETILNAPIGTISPKPVEVAMIKLKYIVSIMLSTGLLKTLYKNYCKNVITTQRKHRRVLFISMKLIKFLENRIILLSREMFRVKVYSRLY